MRVQWVSAPSLASILQKDTKLLKVALTNTQFRALNELRGLPTDVHMMVMTTRSTDSGGVMEGEKKTLDAFVAFVGEEISEGMLSNKASDALFDLCTTIDPDCADWWLL